MLAAATLGDTSEDCYHRTSRQGLEHHRLCIIVFKALSYHHQGINKNNLSHHTRRSASTRSVKHQSPSYHIKSVNAMLASNINLPLSSLLFHCLLQLYHVPKFIYFVIRLPRIIIMSIHFSVS